VAAFHFVRGDQRQARHVGRQCLAIARVADDSDALIEAHYMSGVVACAAGDFVGGCRDLEEAIRIHGDEARDMHRLQYAQDAKASALGWLAIALWPLGRPDEALARAHEGLARVRDTGQPFLIARALAAVGFVHVFRGEAQGPRTPLVDALELCVEQGYDYFHAILSAFAGIDLMQAGRPQQAIERIAASVERLRVMGAELLLTIVHASLADAHRAAGNIDAGLAAIDAGFDCVARNGERWAEAELHRVRGELRLARGDDGGAADCFDNALDVSRAQHASAYRLRAATSLARLRLRQRRTDDAVRLLRETIDAWPEAGDSAELRAARALLRPLA
jgi:adenylate cyclase